MSGSAPEDRSGRDDGPRGGPRLWRAVAGALAAPLGLVMVLGLGVWLAPRACAPSSGTDRAKKLASLREIEERNRRNEPLIPYWDAVGCDVCPGYCRWVDLSLIPLPEAAAEFRRSALDWDPDDLPTGGANWDRLNQMVCIAMRHGPEGERAIMAFLDDDSDIVRFRAAFLILNWGLANEAPLRVMRAFHEDKESPLSFFAYVRLMVWWAEWTGENEPPIDRKSRMFERP